MSKCKNIELVLTEANVSIEICRDEFLDYNEPVKFILPFRGGEQFNLIFLIIHPVQPSTKTTVT